jgi:hypothetical protein
MSKLFSSIAEISYLAEGILVTRLIEGSEITLDNSVENFQKAMTLTGGKRYAAFTDARATVTISKEAMAFGSSEEANKMLIAQAILISSLANRLMGNFMIKFHKPKSPTKLFSDEEEAMSWLREKLEAEKMNGSAQSRSKLPVF